MSIMMSSWIRKAAMQLAGSQKKHRGKAGNRDKGRKRKKMMKRIISAADRAISSAETVLIVGFTAAGMLLGVLK